MSRILIALLAAAAAPAAAGTIPFTASIISDAPPSAPGLRCAPGLTFRLGDSVGAATGASSLGAFEPEQSSCTAGPPPTPVYDGIFAWTFGDGVLTGIFNGTISPGPTPGTLALVTSWTITGGTGRFSDASGSLASTGSVEFVAGRALSDIDFEGFIVTPAPAAIALLGCGLAGLAAVRRRAATA
jgi:hypothetical protein